MDAPIAFSMAKYWDNHAPSFDKSQAFREKPLSTDFLNFANIREGDRVLDLCCGTGFLTFHLKALVGAKGRVVGVDISDGMLAKARLRNLETGANIEFYQHDVMDLGRLELGSFDHIFCASSLIYLDARKALEHWQEFLVHGGSVLADVPPVRAQIGFHIISHVAKQFGVSIGWTAGWVTSAERVRLKWESAGLVNVEVFESEPYFVRKYGRDGGERLFQKVWEDALVKPLADAYPRERIREMFFAEFDKLVGEEGKVAEEMRIFIGKGRKAKCLGLK